MKRLIEHLSNILNKSKSYSEGNSLKKVQTKKIYWLLGVAALGILLMFIGNLGSAPKVNQENQVEQQPKNQNNDSSLISSSNMTVEEEQLSVKMCELLSQIKGVGEVEVSVRLESSSQSQYAINTTTGQKTTQEEDQSGGTRVLTETTENGQLVLIRKEDGTETPVVESASAPKVAGVLVVAQGADEPQIKAGLFEATRVALGVDAHKIMIMPKKEGE